MIQRWSNLMVDGLRTLLRRGALFVLALVTASTLTLAPVFSPTANAQGLTDLLSLGGSLTNGLSSCAIETVGWVICPTMRSIARLADYGFSYINQAFLRIDYSIAANDSGTYKAWELMRTIANALFVIAFMILVYSYLTGKVSGNYSFKRLLPKLIVCAFLVNVSYYLCIIVIDLSNILGDSILEVLKGIASRVGSSVMPLDKAATGYQDGTLTVITSSVMQKAGIAWVLLAPVAAVIVSVATICAAGVVILIMRKTVIAMLILAAPILFVAYLLPNLEKYFFQGARLFGQLLLLYPIVALLLGAGQIVSATIVSVGSNDANYRVSGDSYFARNGGSGSAITDLTAAAAAVLPLLGVWFVFKNMNSIMSTAGARLSAGVSGRRGGKDDEKARVTGNATAGAAERKNLAGNNFGRRQAYSRNKRRAGLSGSVLTGEDESRLGMAGRRQQPNAAQNALENSMKPSDTNADTTAAENALENARLNADADELELGQAVANAVGGTPGGDEKADKKGKEEVTAKDLFNDLNRQRMGKGSKDKERQFSAGPPPAGGGSGGGSGGGGGTAQPSAPTVSYRAPQMAQGGNIVTGTSAGGPTKIVAVPVQVDASALLGQNQMHPPENISQPPISGTEEKAKARAQKYLFDAEKNLDDARNRQDILGNKDTSPSEPPHTSTSGDNKDKEN